MGIKTLQKFFVGADVSKKTLDCVLYDANVEKMKTTNYLKINNDKSGCEQLVNWIKLDPSTREMHIGFRLAMDVE